MSKVEGSRRSDQREKESAIIFRALYVIIRTLAFKRNRESL